MLIGHAIRGKARDPGMVSERGKGCGGDEDVAAAALGFKEGEKKENEEKQNTK